MAVALLKDGPRKIGELKPDDKLEAFDDVWYLPETLYVVLALVLIAAGPGALSFDSLVTKRVLG